MYTDIRGPAPLYKAKMCSMKMAIKLYPCRGSLPRMIDKPHLSGSTYPWEVGVHQADDGVVRLKQPEDIKTPNIHEYE